MSSSTSSESTENLNFCCTCDFTNTGAINANDSNVYIAYVVAKTFWPDPTPAQVQLVYNASVDSGAYEAATIYYLPEHTCGDFGHDGGLTANDSNVMIAYVVAKTFWPDPTPEQVQLVYDASVSSGAYQEYTIKHVPDVDWVCDSSSESSSSESSLSSQSSTSESSISSVSSLSSLSSESSLSSTSESSLSSVSSLSSLSSESSLSSTSESSLSSVSSLSSLSETSESSTSESSLSSTSESSLSSTSESSESSSSLSSESSSSENKIKVTGNVYNEYNTLLGTVESDPMPYPADGGEYTITFTNQFYTEDLVAYIIFTSEHPQWEAGLCNSDGIDVTTRTSVGVDNTRSFAYWDLAGRWIASQLIQSNQIISIDMDLCPLDESSSSSIDDVLNAVYDESDVMYDSDELIIDDLYESSSSSSGI